MGKEVKIVPVNSPRVLSPSNSMLIKPAVISAHASQTGLQIKTSKAKDPEQPVEKPAHEKTNSSEKAHAECNSIKVEDNRISSSIEQANSEVMKNER